MIVPILNLLKDGDRHHVLGIYFISNIWCGFCETWRLFGMGNYFFWRFEIYSGSYLLYFRVAFF
jgi:hypothetical protein